jgi:hypothetical protein
LLQFASLKNGWHTQIVEANITPSHTVQAKAPNLHLLLLNRHALACPKRLFFYKLVSPCQGDVWSDIHIFSVSQ